MVRSGHDSCTSSTTRADDLDEVELGRARGRRVRRASMRLTSRRLATSRSSRWVPLRMRPEDLASASRRTRAVGGWSRSVKPADRRQRRAQLVGDGGDEVVLHLVDLARPGDVPGDDHEGGPATADGGGAARATARRSWW